MYLQLGDIKFEGMVGFETFTDSVEASYAQHDLINRKPKLQRTGDTLREFSGTINFHVSFCDPSAQYAKLEQKRVTGEALPLIHGNGIYEGDFILKTIKRTPTQTDGLGNYIALTCEITLLETDGSTPIEKQSADRAKAFAVTTNRPLAVNRSVNDVNNSAMSASNSNKAAGQAGAAISGDFDNADNKVKRTSGAIPQAQLFLQMAPTITASVNRNINKMSEALDAITSILALNPTMNSYAPTLNAQVNASKAVLITVQALMSDIASLPQVNNAADAAYVLNVQKNSVLLGKQLVNSLAQLNTASSGIAAVLAAKVNVNA